MTKEKKSFLYFLRLPIIFIIVALVSTYLILLANGYIINLKSKSISKTGMIYLKTDPRDVQIYLNDNLNSSKSPTRISNLNSGRYDVKITKDNYQDWQKTLVVEEGLVNIEDNIVLFLKNPVDYPVTDEEKEAFGKLPNQLLNTDVKIVDGSEIWVPDPDNAGKEKLVTRLSTPIKNAIYYSDKQHILFQTKNEIHVVDLDGSNNLKLIALPSEDTSAFFVDQRGENLYYSTQGEIKKAKIH